MRKSLNQIGVEKRTLKTLEHNFCDFYDTNISHMRDSKINLLEIGILDECSIKMWREYFSDATIHGIDILPKKPTVENTFYHKINADNYNELLEFSKLGITWDLIIDDGGHTMKQQQNAIKALWPHLKSGGIFIMEDLHTSFMPKKYNKENYPTTFDFIKCLQDKKTFNSQVIDEKTCEDILNETEKVIIWWNKMNKVTDVTKSPSITSMIFKRLCIPFLV